MVAAYQEITREWWSGAAERFNLLASELVVAEAGAGDADASRARLEALESITLVGVTAEAEKLGRKLLDAQSVPYQAVADAAHIAVVVAAN